MPLPAQSQWPGRQPCRPRLVDGRRGGGPSSVAPRSRNPPTGRHRDSPISSSLFSQRPTPVRSRLRARQQSHSSPDPAGKDSATSSPILTEAGTSVRLSFQSRSLLLLAGKSSGLRQPEMIRQQSCRAGFSLCACVDLAHIGQAYSAAGSECRCHAPPLRVSEFTDDVISRVHLHLCLLGVRFIAQSSVKVDAQIHWCCCV